MKNTRRIVAAVFAAFLAIMPLLASCEKNQTDDGRPTIAVSILPRGNLCRAVAGELAE